MGGSDSGRREPVLFKFVKETIAEYGKARKE